MRRVRTPGAAVVAMIVLSSASARAQEEVRVRTGRAPKAGAVTSVTVEEGRRVAGTQGDALKVVESLPGVARPSLGTGQIVVWGAAPQDTRVYIDGVPLPALYHGSGVRSVINADLVKRLHLVPGAYGAEYGRGLGGLVELETRPVGARAGALAGVGGYAGVDFLDASTLLERGLGTTDDEGAPRVAAAFRQSYLDVLLGSAVDGDAQALFPIPRYRDYQAKVTFPSAGGQEVSLVFLGSHDGVRRVVPSVDPARARSDESTADVHRLYARLSGDDDGAGYVVTPFLGVDRTTSRASLGATPARLDVQSVLYGLRASYRKAVIPRVILVVGFDGLGAAHVVDREGSLNRPARVDDITVFGQAPGSDVNVDHQQVHTVELAPHASVDLRLGPVTVTPGLRLQGLLLDGDRRTPRVGATPAVGFSRSQVEADPRLAVRWGIGERVTLRAAAGVYRQAPDPADLSAVFGNPDLAYATARHGSLGADARITDTLAAEVTGFYKTMEGLVVRSPDPTPLLAKALVQSGEGRAYGVQALLRQAFGGGFSGWVSYTLSRSLRRREGEALYHHTDHDQTHVLGVVGNVEIGRWTFGARFRYATGMPRTDVAGAYYDARGDGYQPVFGVQNGIRLPAFAQLDARVERSFPVGATTLRLYLDVLNVTARKNAEELAFSESYRTRGFVTGMPTLAVAGVRWEF